MTKQDIISKLRENAKVNSGRRIQNREYTIKEGNLDSKLPKQAINILEILMTEGKEVMTEQEVMELMSKHPELSKKQDPWKVCQYYRKSLVDAGFLTVEKIVDEG